MNRHTLLVSLHKPKCALINHLESIRFVNISNGKQTFVVDLLYQPNSMVHLKKIFESEDRLKITTNVQDVDLALTYHNISLKKFMDVEMFDLAVERTNAKKSSGNFFRGYVQLGQSCLDVNIPPPISIQDLEQCSNPNASPTSRKKMENLLNNMALREVQYFFGLANCMGYWVMFVI